jgi:DNA-binding NarL/FixJ family response regulator
MLNKTKVLLVDDHMVVREGLSMLLGADPEFEIVGAAENGRQALAAAQETHPDVVLMDLAMPIMNGVTASRKILQQVKGTKVLVLSSYNDEPAINELVEAGASGYLLKESAAPELLDAIRQVRRGGKAFSPAVARRLRHQHQRDGANSSSSKRSCALTPREMEVLQLIAEGFPNKGIASELGISIKTVEKHRQQVMDKLNIHDIAGLTRYAIERKIISHPEQPPLQPSAAPT